LKAGELAVIVKGTAWLAVQTAAVGQAVTRATRFSVALPACAAELPVRVSVQVAAPAALTVGALQVAIKPWGSPETRLMLTPPPPQPVMENPLSGGRMPLRAEGSRPGPGFAEAVTLPEGVAVTVTVAVESEDMESAVGVTASSTADEGCTSKVRFWLATRPSPTAVTTRVAEVAGAEAEAERVRETGLALTLEAAVSGLADHWAVTPAGRPLTEKLVLPLNDPPVLTVKLTMLDAPWTTATEVDAAVRAKEGACGTVRV
jgi:hypothetical protein